MALILTRKPGESVVIDGPVKITVVEVQGGRTRLAFEADPKVRIHRQEILDRERREERSDRCE